MQCVHVSHTEPYLVRLRISPFMAKSASSQRYIPEDNQDALFQSCTPAIFIHPKLTADYVGFDSVDEFPGIGERAASHRCGAA